VLQDLNKRKYSNENVFCFIFTTEESVMIYNGGEQVAIFRDCNGCGMLHFLRYPKVGSVAASLEPKLDKTLRFNI
jgi:hypothetical protein